MADGCPFHAHVLIAASRTLPLGAWVRVRNHANNRGVIVRIEDRGPYLRGRIIDLSQAAAEHIGMIRAGVAPVTVELLRVEPMGRDICSHRHAPG